MHDGTDVGPPRATVKAHVSRVPTKLDAAIPVQVAILLHDASLGA